MQSSPLSFQLLIVPRKANRLEIYTQTPDDGLALQHSSSLYGKVTMLQKLRPAQSKTDHLFVGTDRYMYFTLSWDAEKRRLRTEKVWDSVADSAARESQTGERCHVDPSGRFMTLEIYEGIITVIPLVQRTKKRKNQEPEVQHLGDPQPSRVAEMFVRSSAFLKPRSQEEKPKLALLYEDTNSQVRLRLKELSFLGQEVIVEDSEKSDKSRGELELGASHLIPIENPACEFRHLLTRKY